MDAKLKILSIAVVVGLFSSVALMTQAFAWTHRDVPLKNEIGEPIRPDRNAAEPYSPRQTCGGCHGYATITSGYHFQQGFDQMSDRHDPKRPWVLSPGMYGKWSPFTAAGRLARKANNSPKDIDLSTYDWIGGGKLSARHKIKAPACGWCHPGGGPMEYGRKADGRADLSMNLSRSEARNKAFSDGDFSSRFTPDGKSHFRESGVLEADCLLCHMPGYRFEARNQQINNRNSRGGATAGAGLGRIQGAVFTPGHPQAGPEQPQFLQGTWNFSRRPLVSYEWSNRQAFAPDGRLKGAMVGRSVDSKNCLNCHALGDAKNTGALNTAQYDHHARANLQCTDCHSLAGRTAAERLRHQIAKGRSPQVSVRDDLDGVAMKTCAGCHLEGQYRQNRSNLPKAARNPARRHAEKFPGASFHFYLIGCTGCHITAQPARAMAVLDMSTGSETGLTADSFDLALSPDDYAAPAREPWKPWLTRSSSGKDNHEHYLAHVPKRMQWFGEKQKNGEIRPIPLHQVSRAAGGIKGLTALAMQTAGGGKVKRSSVVSDRDIEQMIAALTKKGFRNVVYVADRVYALEKGKVVAAEHPATGAQSYAIEHNVLSLEKKMTYGSKGKPDGCMDCHGDGAPFFTKLQIRNIRGFLKSDYPVPREPNAEPQMSEWGLKSVPVFE
jgi:hypothetical protein